ncbi:MAG: dephospho-CoA kinase [Bacteroidales bacterium]|nr:dephospho-CoA kinase [Bacteroidales bacterium]
MKIGLTGNIGSGKSTVVHLLQVMQVPVFVADDVGKEILNDSTFQPQLHALFGPEIFDHLDIPNRKKIAAIVFSDAEKLQQLNQIIHPEVSKRFLQWANQHSESPYVVMESAIIFEHHLDYLFDKIVMVSSEKNIRIQRVMKRDGCTASEVEQRMTQQLSEETKIAQSDFIIKNNNLQPLIPQVLSLHQLLSKL